MANFTKTSEEYIMGDSLKYMILAEDFADRIDEEEDYTISFYEPNVENEKDKSVCDCGYRSVLYYKVECDAWETDIIRVEYNTSSPFALELCNFELEPLE